MRQQFSQKADPLNLLGFSFIIFIGLLMVSMFVEAKPKSLDDLLDQHARPTIEQINSVEPLPADGDAIINSQIMKDMPKIIAAFEKAFPGATFYELGRDAVYMGDILDAFYTSIGQPGRIKRLDASNTSFSPDDEITYQFLKSSGIDVSKIHEGYPIVVFDTTSFSHRGGIGSSGASQSVLVIRSAYRAYVEAGGKASDLVPQLNFISVGGMYSGRSDIIDFASPRFDLDKFIDFQKSTASEEGFALPLFIDASMFAYSHADWHPMFGPFYKNEKGLTVARLPEPGSKSTKSTKSKILAAMVEARDTANHSLFLKMVQLEAAKLGYKFPLQRATQLQEISKKELAAAQAELSKIKAQMEEQARQARAKEKARELEVNKQLRRHLKLSPLAEEYMQLFDVKSLIEDEDESVALQFIIDDLLTSSNLDRWSDNDLVGFLKLFYGSVYMYEYEKKLAFDVAKIARKHKRFLSLILTSDISEDHLGDDSVSYRVEANQKATRKLLSSIPSDGDDDSGCDKHLL